MHPESGFQIPPNYSQFSGMTSLSIFVFLVKFSYWFKFHVNIIIGSGVMTIFFYKGLTSNPEIGNTQVKLLNPPPVPTLIKMYFLK